MTRQISAMCMAGVMALLGDCAFAAEGEDGPYPTLVTAETRANAEKLSALERPGEIFFQDGFESPDSLKNYHAVRQDILHFSARVLATLLAPPPSTSFRCAESVASA